MLRNFQTIGRGNISLKLFFFLTLLLAGIEKTQAQTTLFSENWSSNSFATNGWTFDPSQGNWTMGGVYTPTGATSPNAYFNWSPSITNYATALVSPVINGGAYINMSLDYKLLLDNYSSSTVEQFKIEYKKTWETSWTTLTNYSNASGSFSVSPSNVFLTGTDTASFQLRFVAYGQNSFNLNGWGLDDITVVGTPSTLCFGTPTAGTLSAPSSVCSGNSFTISSTGYTSASGISFTWESSPAGTNNWSTVSTGSPSLTISSLTAATDYRLTVTCGNGGASDVSAVSTVNVSNFYSCYCATNNLGGSGSLMDQVTFGSISNNTAATNPTAAPYYTSFPSLTTTVYAGYAVPLSVTIGAAGTYTGAIVSVWIDYDHSGTFDASEWQQIGTNCVAGTATTINVNIPSTATLGSTGMRIRSRGTGNQNGASDACLSMGSGETEDYIIDIQNAPVCSGTPAVATVSGPISVCPNTSFSLTASGYTMGSGISYQWETAAGSTGAWSAIAGATNPYVTITGGITGGMDYRLITTCNNGGAQDISNTATVATLPFFVCYCGPASGITLNNFAYNIITNVNIMGTPLNNTTTAAGTGGYTLNYPTTATTTTTLTQGLTYTINTTMAFSGYYTGVWIDYNANGTYDATEFVTMTNVGATNSATFTIPLTAIVGQTGMRVRGWYTTYSASDACTASYDYETEDYVINIDPTFACSGTPSPGAITTPFVSLCPNTAFTITGGNLSTGLGISYQWQSRPTGGANPWVSIAGATNTYYTESAGVNVITDYQLITTCSNGGASNTSNILTIYQSPFYSCYCASMASQTGDEEIYSVTVNGTNSNTFSGQGNGCSTTAPGTGSILNRYSNFTSLGSFVQMMQGSSASFTVEENECDGATYYAFGTSIWIDYNQNGSYADAGEQVFVETSTATGPRNVTGSFIVPLTATTGQTGMRVTVAEGYSGASLTPCLSYGYGETEDYIVDITAATGCTGTPATAVASTIANTCPNASFTLNASGYTVASGMTFQWESSAAGAGTWAAISGATSINYTVSSGITSATDYRLISTCTSSSASSTSNTVTVSVNPFYYCYCAPPATTLHNFVNDYMSNAQILTTTLNSSNTTTTSGYTFVSPTPASNTANLTQGATYSFVGTINSSVGSPLTAGVWIDYNQNGTFDASEYASITIGATLTATLNVPATATPGQTGMRVRLRGGSFGASDACLTFGSGETEDYIVTIDAGTSCTGTPSVVTASGPANSCANIAFNLVASGYTYGSGISYQWESSALGTGVWSAISGATTTTYSVTGFSASTDYRFITTCSNSGLSDISNTISVSLNAPSACYCTPSVSVQDELISNTTFDTYSNPNTGFGTAGYQDFTSLTPIPVSGGNTYNFSASISPFYGGDVVAVWIDFNQDGNFANPSERVFLNAPTASPATGTIAIPATALGGITRMRVRLDYSNSNPSPCGNTTYGNIEDYMVNITPAALCTGTPDSGAITTPQVNMCPNVAFTLTSSGLTVGSGITYQWESRPTGANPWVPITGATGNTYTESAGVNTVTDYHLVTTCAYSGLSNVSNIITIWMNSVTQCYCNPVYTYGCTYADDINSFTLTGESGSNINDLNTGCTSGGYSDRTYIAPVNLAVGTSYSGTISSDYSSGEYANIWIDFGDDGSFDASDAVGSVNNFGTTASNFNISIPANVATGNHRMRVRCAWNTGSGSSITPCASYSYGETHDYIVHIDTVTCLNPSVMISSSANNICEGTYVTFTASGTDGGAAPTYQWLLNNAPLAGETNSSYTSSSLTDMDVVSCELTSSCNTSLTAMSNDIIMSVLAFANPSVIAVESTNFICAGTPVTFTTIPTDGGSNPSYQWYINGIAIVGETNSSFTTSSLNDVDVVSVDMTTSEPCFVSATTSSNDIIMSITPLANPSVIASESVNNICPGTSVVFTALGTDGGTNPTYQWYLNGSPLIGETNDTYTTSLLNNGDVVTVDMTTSETCYSVQTTTSNAVTMYVNSLTTPTVTASTNTTNVCTGATVTFTSSSTDGGISPAYQWYVNGGAISGETNDAFTSSSVNDGDVYSIEMTSSAGCVTTSTVMSNYITMSVAPLVANITASGPLALCSGGNVTLTATSGTSYTWSNGATTQSITVSSAGSYSVSVITSAGCVANASPINVISKTMPATVKIKLVGASTVCSPSTVSFSADPNASSLYGFNFQWNLNGTAISGATDTSYIASGASSGNVTLTVTGSTCTKTSMAKVYTIKPLPVASFTTGGAPTTFCNGGSVTLTAPTITGYAYTWLKDGISSGGGMSKVVKIAGSYTVIASLGGCKDTADNSVVVVVNPLPTAAISNLTPTTFCAGDSCVMSATPTGGSNYAWVNGTITVNTSNSTYAALTAGTYKVIVTDANGCVSKASTSSVKPKVNPIPVAAISPAGPVTITATGNVKLNASPSAGVTWQWFKNGVAISNATTKTYTATSAGNYTVAVTKLGCTGTSIATVVNQTGVKNETGSTNSEETSFEIAAYPNPVSDVLTVTVSGIEDVNGTLQVMDFNGRLVISKEMKQANTTVDMTSIASGIYLVRFKDAEGRTGTIKVTKQ